MEYDGLDLRKVFTQGSPKATIIPGDCIEMMRGLEPKSIHCCVTSPPYFNLRDYQIEGQIGLEKSPDEYVARMVEVFREVWRILRDDGTLWLNLGDSYANDTKWGGTTGGKHVKGLHGTQGVGRNRTQTGLKPKNLIGIPWRVAFALQADGWYLRSDIIWEKSNPLPESVRDRPTKSHEHIFLLTKKPKYFYDNVAIMEEAVGKSSGAAATFKRESGKRGIPILNQAQGTHRPNREHVEYNKSTRNKRDVWKVATQSFKEAHFAVFPSKLIIPCIKAGTSEKGCCPKCGKPWVRSVERKTWKPSCTCHSGYPIPATVFDPFSGAGTTGVVSLNLGRNFTGIELNPKYVEMSKKRIQTEKLK